MVESSEVTEVYKGFEIHTGTPIDPYDPREDDDGMITKIFCFHKRYQIGDKHNYNSSDFDGWEEFLTQIRKDYNVLNPRLIRMYDHSGIGISLEANSYPYDCPWDSGWIGWIFIDVDKLKRTMNWKRLNLSRITEAIKFMNDEFKRYAAYVGDELVDVWIPNISDGGIGEWIYDQREKFLAHARRAIDSHILYQQKRHAYHVKAWIKNHVPLFYRKPFIIEGSNV